MMTNQFIRKFGNRIGGAKQLPFATGVVAMLAAALLFLHGGAGSLFADSPLVNVANVTVGKAPRYVAVNPNTNKIYVSNEQYQVSVIDGETNTLIKHLNTPHVPDEIVVNPNTNRIYVRSIYTNHVWVINGATDEWLDPIVTPTGGYSVAVNPVTNRLYVGGGRQVG